MNKVRKRCQGCSHWVKVFRIHLETGDVDVSKSYCDSEEVMSAGCSPSYPKLSSEEAIKKHNDKRLWKFRA